MQLTVVEGMELSSGRIKLSLLHQSTLVSPVHCLDQQLWSLHCTGRCWACAKVSAASAGSSILLRSAACALSPVSECTLAGVVPSRGPWQRHHCE